MRTRCVRTLTVLLCAVGMLAATGLGALAAPPDAADAADAFSDAVAQVGDGENSETATQAGGGQFISNFALQFHGYSYVWAGNTPAGFDCSGFTQYVILNMLGIDIGHGVAGQTNYGAWVNWGDWQSGDLVYFAGTYRAGISHAGVYIGGGEFIHAENSGTGVVISSLYSDYYAGHYYGAYRLW